LVGLTDDDEDDDPEEDDDPDDDPEEDDDPDDDPEEDDDPDDDSEEDDDPDDDPEEDDDPDDDSEEDDPILVSELEPDGLGVLLESDLNGNFKRLHNSSIFSVFTDAFVTLYFFATISTSSFRVYLFGYSFEGRSVQIFF